jgi:hypothetical protein
MVREDAVLELAGAYLRDLTHAPRDRVRVALAARARVEERSQPLVHFLLLVEDLAVQVELSRDA